MTIPHAGTDLALLLRVVVALVLAAAIGWERERRDRAAGLRTHMLVAAAAALFVSLGGTLVGGYGSMLGDRMAYDPTRLVHAVAVGVGFLGAGTIFVRRAKDRVHGLTTAASIWATAAIGVAAGLERWVLATGSSVLVVVVLGGVGALEERLGDQRSEGDP